MWFPPELFRIIKEYMGFRKYYLRFPSKFTLHEEYYDLMDETVKSKIWQYLNDDQPVSQSIGDMLNYMIRWFDLVLAVTKRDWRKWRTFTLLMLIRTATYQREATTRIDMCIDCFDGSCEECVRLRRLQSSANVLRGKYKDWMEQ